MSREYRELLEKIENKKAEAKALLAENKVEECKAMKVEIDKMQDKANLLKELENEDMEGGIQDMTKLGNIENKANANGALNKALLGKPLTDAENALVEKTGADGAFLVPIEQQNMIHELKRDLNPLKQFCNVIPVGSNSGTMPLEVSSDEELVSFDEMTEIGQTSPKFAQVKWNTTDFGDICPISNSLLEDEKANLMSFLGMRFAKKSVRCENSKIIKALKDNAGSYHQGNSAIEGLNRVLNIGLDVAISANAIIVTNQDGYNQLDSLSDAQGRPMLTESVAMPGAKFYKGRQIVTVSNSRLASREITVKNADGKDVKETLVPYFVGDMKEFITIFDRKGYEIAVSKEAGFTRNSTMLRIVQRFDTKVIDSDAMKLVEIVL